MDKDTNHENADRTGSSAAATVYLGCADALIRRDLVPGATGFTLASANGAGPPDAVSAADLADRLLAWLAAEALPPAAVHPVDLSIAELASVAAMVDAFREERLRALIERRAPEPDLFSIDDLLFQVNMGCLSGHTRWFTGILAAHAPIEFAPVPEDLREGLIGLELREWIREADHRWEPQRTLIELCERLGNLNPYAVIATDPHGASPIAPLTLMRIESGVCALQYRYQDRREPWARLSLADSAATKELLHDHLRQLLAQAQAAAAATEAGPSRPRIPLDLPELTAIAPANSRPIDLPETKPRPAARPIDLPEGPAASTQRAARPTDLPN